MDRTIINWEDKKAFVALDNGLALYKKIIKQSALFLKKQACLTFNNIPQLILEIGETQKTSITKLLRENHYKKIEVFKDIAQKHRWICASY